MMAHEWKKKLIIGVGTKNRARFMQNRTELISSNSKELTQIPAAAVRTLDILAAFHLILHFSRRLSSPLRCHHYEYHIALLNIVVALISLAEQFPKRWTVDSRRTRGHEWAAQNEKEEKNNCITQQQKETTKLLDSSACISSIICLLGRLRAMLRGEVYLFFSFLHGGESENRQLSSTRVLWHGISAQNDYDEENVLFSPANKKQAEKAKESTESRNANNISSSATSRNSKWCGKRGWVEGGQKKEKKRNEASDEKKREWRGERREREKKNVCAWGGFWTNQGQSESFGHEVDAISRWDGEVEIPIAKQPS